MNNLKQHGSQIFMATLAFIVATILLLWGWNSAMPYLFELPTIQFKQALGLMVLIGILSFFLRHRQRHNRRDHTSSSHHDSVVGKQS